MSGEPRSPRAPRSFFLFLPKDVGSISTYAVQLVETAAAAAGHGATLINSVPRLSESALRGYWTASRSRLDRWSTELRQYQRESQTLGRDWAVAQWHSVLPVMEEVLTTEMITRVWSAVAILHDSAQARQEAGPLVRNILLGHLENRHRTLQIMATVAPTSRDHSRALNQLRGRCERWTDMLLSHLQTWGDVREFAVDAEQMLDFAEITTAEVSPESRRQAWTLTVDAIEASWEKSPLEPGPNAELTQRIAASIFACLPATALPSKDQLRSVWTARMHHTAEDAQSLVEELLAEQC